MGSEADTGFPERGDVGCRGYGYFILGHFVAGHIEQCMDFFGARKKWAGKKGAQEKRGPGKKGPTVFGKGEKWGPFFSFLIKHY